MARLLRNISYREMWDIFQFLIDLDGDLSDVWTVSVL